ncbi:DUF3718 domain-containing protein [Colwellia psychrerythraea]|uniref:DUF3718 domain-containing protein n=1 Tax=Colwellia psychrerythraea TaxID=28229 RepID=A0A099KKZ7_COLPS|nr:DUF3718 domain-containing protein [Colwellia psychrerythraea]KGJ90945.1 Protein of unknown function DUF3718 [Colwellia psychrerythraea]
MTTIKTTLIALATAVPALAFSLTSQATTSSYMDTALVEVCKAAQSNNILKLQSAIKSYHLQNKTVALKVMCNGDDIITFAEKKGATKTAAKLQKSVGGVSITDVALIEKINVTFTES